MPFILVALVVVIVLGQSMEIIIILLIVFSWGAFARQARGETLALKEREYVAGARVAGASSLYLMFRHILPGLINTINCDVEPDSGAAYPGRSRAQLPWPGDPPSDAGVGSDGR